MSRDASEGTLRQAPITDSMSKSDVEEAFAGPDIERIYIGDEFADQSGEPTTVRKCERVRNRVHGTITEFTFYDEGFLKLREGNRKKINKEHILELHFLNPEPVTTRRFATVSLWSSLGMGILALFVSFVLPLTNHAQFTVSLTAILATLATLSLLIFVYRSDVIYQFFTTNGQTEVLTLTGSFGCNHHMCAMAREIRQAIVRASAETGAHDDRYLRAEMLAHYKLAKTGVITRDACSDAAALILSKFG